MTSILTKKQTKTYGPKIYTENGQTYKLTATVRYDEQCGNGHNTFVITGDQYRKGKNGHWYEDSCGCMHEKIATHFPALAPLIKWHGTNSDGPTYYIENTVYHVLEHGPTDAWVYFDDPANGVKGLCVTYCSIEEAHDICIKPGNTFNPTSGAGYRFKEDEKTAKVRNLDHARSSAVWPDATDDDLTAPGLEERLQARLPQLMAEFKRAVESLEFMY